MKDTFKTAKAKFIVPTEIEDKFIGNDDVEQMCLLGLGMPQPILLVSLSETGRARPRDAVTADLSGQLDRINEHLPSYKRVGAIVVSKEDFTVPNGMLTPTLKVKRPQVHQRFADRMPNWLDGSDKVVWE